MDQLLALLPYAFVMSITPGPNNLMVLASGARFGFARTLPHIWGIVLGFTVQTLVMCWGLGWVFVRYPWVHEALRWLGLAYMAYLSAQLLRAERPQDATGGAHPISFWAAAGFQWLNPKAWVMAVSTATYYFPTQWPLWQASLAVSVITVVVNWPCVAVWAGFGVQIKRFLDTPMRLKVFNLVMALMLFGTTVYILFHS